MFFSLTQKTAHHEKPHKEASRHRLLEGRCLAMRVKIKKYSVEVKKIMTISCNYGVSWCNISKRGQESTQRHTGPNYLYVTTE